MEALGRLEALVAIMDRLREPGGCPWDREQDYSSLRRYLLEECYEVADALDRQDFQALREELGDLLFQIVFLVRLAQERGEFVIEDVIRGIAEKLIRRHPHVFQHTAAETTEEVERQWERIKRSERSKTPTRQRPGASSILDGVPTVLPALLKARLLGERVARVGFDWKRADDILDQAQQELDELRAAFCGGSREDLDEELGDALFTLVMFARRSNIDPEGALERTNLKFRRRFGWIERELEQRGIALEQAGSELLERLWRESKQPGGLGP